MCACVVCDCVRACVCVRTYPTALVAEGVVERDGLQALGAGRQLAAVEARRGPPRVRAPRVHEHVCDTDTSSVKYYRDSFTLDPVG